MNNFIKYDNVCDVTIDRFHWDSKRRELVAEASDIGLKRWDTLLRIEGKEKTVSFVLDHFDYVGNPEEREIAGAWYRAMLGPNDIKVLVIND